MVKKLLLLHELPYQVNKASLIEKIAELVRDKKIDGITHLAMNQIVMECGLSLKYEKMQMLMFY